MENKSCPICEKRLIEQTWTAKSGKACHAFRHEDWKTAETECKDIETGKPFIEFIDDRPKLAYKAKKVQAENEQYQNLMRSMEKTRTLIKALAVIQGLTTRDLIDEAQRLEETK